MNRKQILRKKIISSGAESLTDTELLEFLLSHSGAEENTAEHLLSGLGGIKTAADANPGILTAQYGISSNTAVLLKLIPALCHEKSVSSNKQYLINSTEKSKIFFESRFVGYSKEHLCAVAVKDNMRTSEYFCFAVGNSSSISIKCRDIVSFAITSSTNKLIIAHNHPDGDPSPSENDLTATRRIIEALRPLDIKVLDHIIVGRDSSLSLRELLESDIFDEAPEYKTKQQMQNICKK